MTNLLHADIFFFITSIAVAIFTLALIIAAILFIQTLFEVRAVVRRVRTETDRIFDLTDMLANKAGGWAGAIGGLGYRLWKAHASKGSAKRNKKSSR